MTNVAPVRKQSRHRAGFVVQGLPGGDDLMDANLPHAEVIAAGIATGGAVTRAAADTAGHDAHGRRPPGGHLGRIRRAEQDREGTTEGRCQVGRARVHGQTTEGVGQQP
jgi:hypothetical protein